MPHGIQLYVAGDFACFTRPEMKMERVSYDVITPSAARGVLEAVYWKPQMRWIIDRLHVLKPVRFTNIRRNEVAHKAAAPGRPRTRDGMDTAEGLHIEHSRQQRAALLLRDVAYLIDARLEVLDSGMKPGGPKLAASAAAGKHLAMFKRRARAGQCFHQPYLGCREFPARFHLAEPGRPAPPSELPELERDRPLGWMLHDLAYLPAGRKDGDSFLESSQGRRGRAEPRFFDAVMENGVITVPPFSFPFAPTSPATQKEEPP